MNDSTKSAESLSTVRDRRATCSISSLKLTAPSLYFHSKDLGYDASKQPFQAWIPEIRQRLHSRFLPGFELLTAALLDSQPIEHLEHLLCTICRKVGRTPKALHE